jgi:SAM-dependent methyltransferase
MSIKPKHTGEFFIPGLGHKSTEEEHFERYRFAALHVPRKRVLDIACGVGYGSRILIEARAASVLGCDILESNIDYARREYGCEGLTFMVTDAARTSFRSEFDVVVCFETIEHIDDFRSVLANLRNALKEEGMLILSSPNRTISSPHLGVNDRAAHFHLREFTPSEFSGYLIEAGFCSLEWYGQRQQRFFQNPFLERHYKKLFKPSRKADPRVTPLRKGLGPEYFVVVAGRHG